MSLARLDSLSRTGRWLARSTSRRCSERSLSSTKMTRRTPTCTPPPRSRFGARAPLEWKPTRPTASICALAQRRRPSFATDPRWPTCSPTSRSTSDSDATNRNPWRPPERRNSEPAVGDVCGGAPRAHSGTSSWWCVARCSAQPFGPDGDSIAFVGDLDGVVDGLGDDLASADDEGVGTVSHAGGGPVGCPLEEGDVAVHHDRCVLEARLGQLRLEELGKDAHLVTAPEEAEPGEYHDVVCDIAFEIGSPVARGGERQVVVEDLAGRALGWRRGTSHEHSVPSEMPSPTPHSAIRRYLLVATDLETGPTSVAAMTWSLACSNRFDELVVHGSSWVDGEPLDLEVHEQALAQLR